MHFLSHRGRSRPGLGPYKGKETGETALFRTLLDGLEAGEVVLGDRCFASYFMIAELMQRGVDGLFRMHQRRKFDFRGGRQLGFEHHIVTWTKPERPEWIDEETYAQIPNTMEIRELRFKVQKPGFRVNELVLVTTMLDAEEYTKEELADLFLQRWNIELDLRSIKDVLQMDVLRCKTPEMVEKEIWIHLLAYNLIRGVAAKAAEAHDKQPRLISFKGTLQTMTAFQETLRWATPPDREHLGLPPKTWSSLNGNRTTGREPGSDPCENDPDRTRSRPSSATSKPTSTPA